MRKRAVCLLGRAPPRPQPLRPRAPGERRGDPQPRRPGPAPSPPVPACLGHPFRIPGGAGSPLPRQCRCEQRTPIPVGTAVPERLPAPPVPALSRGAAWPWCRPAPALPAAMAPARTPGAGPVLPENDAERSAPRRVPGDARGRPRVPPRPILRTGRVPPSRGGSGGRKRGRAEAPKAEPARGAEPADGPVPGSPHGALRGADGRAPRGFFIVPRQTQGPAANAPRSWERGTSGPAQRCAPAEERLPDGAGRGGRGNETGGSRQDFSE